jgi:GDPmannose 4,6-dehydratase
MFACNGILFNHESPLRGETFVSRKITRAAARIALGLESKIFLGNLNALRDWGDARDFVRAQWLILQQKKPDDYVIATGVQHSVRELCEYAFREAGIEIEWKGSGVKEKGVVAGFDAEKVSAGTGSGLCGKRLRKGQPVVLIDPRYLRPTEVDTLLGDPSRAKKKLGWTPEISFEEMIGEMVVGDIEEATREAICRRNGFDTPSSFEANM